MPTRRPRVLVAAGFEPSGRMGLLADVSAVWLHGGDARGVITALTTQGGKASHFLTQPQTLGSVERQVEVALKGGVDAVKLGVVPDRRVLRGILRLLAPVGVAWVVDPVIQTSRGQVLSLLRPSDYRDLAGDDRMLTPNVPELEWLLGLRQPLQSPLECAHACEPLLRDGWAAVVVKGGHLPRSRWVTDTLILPTGARFFRAARISRKGARGTGCRFASALATERAKGQPWVGATLSARGTLRRYLRDSKNRPSPGSRSG